MNHRDTEIPERKAPRVVATLCALFLCGSRALGAADNPPRLYNDGVLAYKSNDFARAAAAFESAMSTQDRALQQRSFYNLGNTSYRLGQGAPAQVQQRWERALKSYETALALDPKDADAKFNRDFVKKKLEEIKQQQQQQQNQKDHQDNPQKQQKDEQEQQQQQDQQQQSSKDKQGQQPQQQKPRQTQDQQQQQDQEQKDKQQQQQQAQQPKPSPSEQEPQESRAEPGNYDKLEATAILNELRENERNWNFFPEVQMKDLKDSGAPAKDW